MRLPTIWPKFAVPSIALFLSDSREILPLSLKRETLGNVIL